MARSGASTPGAFVPAFQNAADNGAVRHADRAGALAVRLPRHPRDARDAELRGRSHARCSRRSPSRARSTAQAAIDGLLKAFKVHLDPRFGTWGLTPNGQGQNVYEVTPPKAPTPSTAREGTTTTTTTTVPAAVPGASPGTP